MVGKWSYAVKWLSMANRATYFHSVTPSAMYDELELTCNNITEAGCTV